MPTRIAPLAAALAVLALAAAFAAPRAAAEEPADAEAASTVTTTLRPGWNMAAEREQRPYRRVAAFSRTVPCASARRRTGRAWRRPRARSAAATA